MTHEGQADTAQLAREDTAADRPERYTARPCTGSAGTSGWEPTRGPTEDARSSPRDPARPFRGRPVETHPTASAARSRARGPQRGWRPPRARQRSAVHPSSRRRCSQRASSTFCDRTPCDRWPVARSRTRNVSNSGSGGMRAGRGRWAVRSPELAPASPLGSTRLLPEVVT